MAHVEQPPTLVQRFGRWSLKMIGMAVISVIAIVWIVMVVIPTIVMIVVAIVTAIAALWFSYCLAVAVSERLLAKGEQDDSPRSHEEPYRNYWFAPAWSDLTGTVAAAFRGFRNALPGVPGDGTEGQRTKEEWIHWVLAALSLTTAILVGSTLALLQGSLHLVGLVVVCVVCFGVSGGRACAHKALLLLHERQWRAARPAPPRPVSAPVWMLRRWIGRLVLIMWFGGAVIGFVALR